VKALCYCETHWGPESEIGDQYNQYQTLCLLLLSLGPAPQSENETYCGAEVSLSSNPTNGTLVPGKVNLKACPESCTTVYRRNESKEICQNWSFNPI
jgi:hypothetical protein